MRKKVEALIEKEGGKREALLVNTSRSAFQSEEKRANNGRCQTSFCCSSSYATRRLKFKAAWNISSNTRSLRFIIFTFHNKNCVGPAINFCIINDQQHLNPNDHHSKYLNDHHHKLVTSSKSKSFKPLFLAEITITPLRYHEITVTTQIF